MCKRYCQIYILGEKETFYITFSDDPKSFRLVRLDGYYYKDIVGKCVGVVGIIKVLDQVPYIEMKETIGIIPTFQLVIQSSLSL